MEQCTLIPSAIFSQIEVPNELWFTCKTKNNKDIEKDVTKYLYTLGVNKTILIDTENIKENQYTDILKLVSFVFQETSLKDK